MFKPGVQIRLNIRQIVAAQSTHRSLSDVRVRGILYRQLEPQVEA